LPIFDSPRDVLREDLIRSTIANRKSKIELEARGLRSR